MPTFHYRAYSDAGDLVEGEIAADAKDQAEEALWSRGLTPFETRETGRSASLTLFNRNRPPDLSELTSFTREFAALEQADIPLDHGLRILATQSASPRLRALAEEILGRVVNGTALSEALAGRSDVFSQEYVNVVRAGETIGDVGQALSDLATMLERRVELRSRITSALIYPCMLIALAIISTGIVLATLVPNIAPIFVDNNRPLPSGLKFILDVEANWHSIAITARFHWPFAFSFLAFRPPAPALDGGDRPALFEHPPHRISERTI